MWRRILGHRRRSQPMEQYRVYEDTHRESLQFGLTAATMGKWTMLGPFRHNRDKISYLNKNTEVLARILEQHKKDQTQEPANWGYAGDLGRVTEELAYVLASLGDRSAVDQKGLEY